jgi:hypothetical protein
VFAPKSRASLSYLNAAVEFIERQDLILRRRAGVAGDPPKRPMAELRARAHSALMTLHAHHGQAPSDAAALSENRRALRDKLSSGRTMMQNLHFWLVNAAIYYRGPFFMALILGLLLSLFGLANAILILFPPAP